MGDYNEFEIEVVGTHFTDAEKILRNVIKDLGEIWDINGYQYHKVKLSLVPEPNNEYDSNAIAVYSNYPTPPRARIKRSGKLGYLPSDTGITLTETFEVNAVVKEGFKHMYIKIDASNVISNVSKFKEPEPSKEIIKNSDNHSTVIENTDEHVDTIFVNKYIFAFFSIILGILGIQWFYAKKYKKALLYVAFSWSGIPILLGVYQGVKALQEPSDSNNLIKR